MLRDHRLLVRADAATAMRLREVARAYDKLVRQIKALADAAPAERPLARFGRTSPRPSQLEAADPCTTSPTVDSLAPPNQPSAH